MQHELHDTKFHSEFGKELAPYGGVTTRSSGILVCIYTRFPQIVNNILTVQASHLIIDCSRKAILFVPSVFAQEQSFSLLH